MKGVKSLILSCLIFVFWVFCPVHAQDQNPGEGIRISPVRFEKNANPGDIITDVLKVKNESNSKKRIKLFVRDFRARDEGGTPLLLDPGSEEGNYISSWISYDDIIYEFEPFEEKDIAFKVEVPQNSGPGGHYGALVAGILPPEVSGQSEDKGAAMAIAQQAASLILLRISGDINEDGMVKDFKADKYWNGNPFKITFMARIENKGNVHIRPAGMIEIYNIFGERREAVPFNGKGSNILPRSVRKLDQPWEGKFGIGKYKAVLLLNYGLSPEDGGQGMKTMYSETFFWIIPWKILLPSLVALISIVILVLTLMKLYRDKAFKRAMEELNMAQVSYKNIKKGMDEVPRIPIGILVLFFLSLVFLLGAIIYFIFFA